MKKNGDYNNIEEILQKRYEGVKKDIKDPGFVNINYAGAQRKERFYEKPAVYAAGLVLVAVLVCGGTFIGLKYLEKLGASRIDPLTSDTVGISGELTGPDVTDTEQVTDDDCGTDKLRAPVYMTVKSGGETIYPNAYFLWSEKYSDGDGAWIDADGAGAETVKAVPDIAFDGVSLEIGYENASKVHYSIKQNEKPVYSGDGDLSGFFSEAEQDVYRVIASFTVTGREIDGKYESSCYECPFDVAVRTTEVTEETEGIKGYYPVYLRITCGGKREYLPSYLIWESVNDGKTENITQTSITSKDYEDMDNIPVFDIKDFEIGYGRVYADGMEATVKCRMAGRDGTFDIDDICDILTSSYPGVYRFIAVADFKIVTNGVTREGCYEYPFDINYVYEQSSDSAEVTEPDDVPVFFGIGSGNLFHMFNPVLHSVITDAGTEIVETGEPGYVWTVVIKGRENFGFVFSEGVEFVSASADKYGEKQFDTVVQSDAEEKMLQLWDGGATDFTVTVYMSKQTEGETRIYRGAFIPVFEDADETTDITPPGTYKKGKRPVYLKVFDANESIYPDAYESYGLWGTEGAKNVPVLHYDGSDIDIAYVQLSGSCYVGYRLYGSDEEEHISVDYINDYLKHAHTGTYRFIVNFSIEIGDEIIGYGYPFDVEIPSAETETDTETETNTETDTETVSSDTTETYPPQEFIDLIEVRANGEKINGLIPEWETFTGYELEIVGRENILIYYKTGMTVSAINKASVVSVESTVRVQGGYNDPVSHNSLDSLNNAITKALQDGADSIYITVDVKNSSAYAHYSFEIMFGQKGKAPVYLSVAGDGRIYPDAYPDHVDVYENGNKAKTVGNGLSDAKNIPTVNYGEGLSVNYSALTDKYLPQRLIKYELYDINTGKTLAEGPKIGNINAYLESANSGIYRAVVSFYLNDFNMNDGTTVTGYYVYPFNVYVEYKETSDAKKPVYLTVSNGNGTIYPDGYFCWCEMYDDRSGSWVDGCNGLAPEYVSAIEFDGELNLRYENAGNGTEIDGIGCYDENENPCYPSVGTFDDLNRFFKTADKGVYRVYVSFIIKGRLIDGKYERECWEYTFDVVVK